MPFQMKEIRYYTAWHSRDERKRMTNIFIRADGLFYVYFNVSKRCNFDI